MVIIKMLQDNEPVEQLRVLMIRYVLQDPIYFLIIYRSRCRLIFPSIPEIEVFPSHGAVSSSVSEPLSCEEPLSLAGKCVIVDV